MRLGSAPRSVRVSGGQAGDLYNSAAGAVDEHIPRTLASSVAADAPAMSLTGLVRLALELIAAPFEAKAVIGPAPMLALTFVPVERAHVN